MASEKQVRIPELADGFSVVSSSSPQYGWWVEAHGEFANVDAMAGPSGFMGDFHGYETGGEGGLGAQKSSGVYTTSLGGLINLPAE